MSEFEAPVEELGELGGEAEVEFRVPRREVGPLDVSFLELLKVTRELDADGEDPVEREGWILRSPMKGVHSTGNRQSGSAGVDATWDR